MIKSHTPGWCRIDKLAANPESVPRINSGRLGGRYVAVENLGGLVQQPYHLRRRKSSWINLRCRLPLDFMPFLLLQERKVMSSQMQSVSQRMGRSSGWGQQFFRDRLRKVIRKKSNIKASLFVLRLRKAVGKRWLTESRFWCYVGVESTGTMHSCSTRGEIGGELLEWRSS
jgi:hypothetical protein